MLTLDVYIVYTENRHNQILVFETYKEAFNWCKSCTTYNDKQINEIIKQPWKPTKEHPVYSVSQEHNPTCKK